MVKTLSNQITRSPTALNKRGRKVVVDGYRFDSQKEANFYVRFVRNSGANFKVHPRYELLPAFNLGGKHIRRIDYTPDFVIYDDGGQMIHVYDVKNGFTVYAIDTSVKLRFKLFAKRYNRFVECVVVRAHDFKTHTFYYDKKDDIHVRKSIFY